MIFYKYYTPIFVPYGVNIFHNTFIDPNRFVVKRGRSPSGTANLLENTFFILIIFVMINNSSIAKWDRLNCKQLDNQFQNEIIKGLNCSPFEARAILDSVHKVYADLFDNTGSLKPGQIQFVITGIENGPAVALKAAKMVTATLTLDAGEEDIRVRKEKGVVALRQHRMQRVCHEAFMQGGVLTLEDLANRLFNCGERTLVRDIKALNDQGIVLPMRSTIKDMGRTLSHRVIIVKKWLQGMEYTQISQSTHHSPSAVANYVKRFKQVVILAKEGYEVNTIAFMAQISQPLAEQYVDLWNHAPIVQVRIKELSGDLKKRDRRLMT